MASKFQTEVLHLRKEDILVQLQGLLEHVSTKDINSSEAVTLLDEVKTLKTGFQSLKLDIFKYNARVSELSECVNISDFSTFDALFREIVKKCSSFIPHESNNSQLIKDSSFVSLPLEKLNLFTWDGNIAKWNSWFSMFSSTVDANEILSPNQKFLYLKKYLTGEPLAICEQLEVNDINYYEALKLLKNRYQNERRLGSYYFSQLLNFHKKDFGTDLSKFLTIHRSNIAALKNLNEISDLADFCFFHLAYNNLDFKLQQAFDMSRNFENKIPKVEELLQFVQFAATNQELKTDMKPKIKNKNFVGFTQPEKNKSTYLKRQDKNCPLCSESHRLYICDQFKSLLPDHRLKLIVKWKRCVNCLSFEHSPCPSKYDCSICHQRHHTLLHSDATKSSSSAGLVACATGRNRQVLLGTIVCEVKDNFQNFFPIRCLCDSGAQVSVASHSLIKKLGLKFTSGPKFVRGISASNVPALGQVQLTLRTLQPNEKRKTILLKALVLKNICGDLPTYDVSSSVYKKFAHLQLADETFIKSSKIDLILGADIFPELLSLEQPNLYKDEETGLIAQNTIFGYIIQGSVPENSTEFIPEVLFTSSLEETMEKFWKTEEVLMPLSTHPDDVYCEDFFKSTTQRLPDGRFAVRLPFRPGAIPENLKNRNLALANYYNLERRLQKSEKLFSEYKNQILNYLKLGHMSISSNIYSYILPQLLVVRESALTTQIRICFNASALTYLDSNQNPLSLNQLLLPGPKLQSDLTLILTKFRLNEIGLIADIEMMFRMVQVQQKDRKYLHLFFRENLKSDLLELELNVLPFGLTCSPYLAQRVIRELLDADGHLFPDAAQALQNSLYVDDFVGSFATIEEARKVKQEMCTLMQRGGFTLRKWASSHPEVLENTSFENKGKIQFDDENRTVKVLGLQWDAPLDSFTYKIVKFNSDVTKRSCLSYIARTFDCLGLVCPVIFWMKSFLQKLWNLKVDWDETLSEPLNTQWLEFIFDMENLTKLKIPRCVLHLKASEIHLACFSDGSQRGYATCIYLVVKYSNGSVSSNLLTAKSKLAPLKTISIPRLELCGALLMTRLCNYTLQALKNLQIKSIHLFTDSQIVLAWIKTSPHKLKTFVANRISIIQELSAGMIWSYVSTLENPSDCASRGLLSSQLLSHPLWWAGPKFLLDDPKNWSRPPENIDIDLPELKPSSVFVIINREENYLYTSVILKCSRLEKLQRVFGYVLRFIHNCKNSTKRSGPLSVGELKDSLVFCIRLSQHQEFSLEIKALRENKIVGNRLLKLNPYLDDLKLMRVGGRLKNSLLSEEEKHPIILAKNSHLSILICEYYHRILLHSGPRTTRALIQRTYWILSINSLLRKLIHSCMRCLRWQAKPMTPLMGELPSTRVRISRCFASTTMDMAGPFLTKESLIRKRTIHKTYVCVFVCEATKAVHFEAVTELSTSAFLAAFHRFVARRSLPHLLRSDNGRNFIGARRVLKECQNFLTQHNDEISSALRSRQVTWKLNPAHGAHFGGLHEAAVKSFKLIFYRIVGNTILTLEEFNTLLARIEAVLNSRPLTFLSSDPNDGVDYLSPGHFMVGGPLVSAPEEPLDLHMTIRNRWVKVQQLTQHFWQRFHREYLHTLMQREKWMQNTPNVTVGQLVYITGDKTSPLTWPIGRVVTTYPGADGIVRVVDVKTSSGVYRRPVHKLVLIPSS